MNVHAKAILCLLLAGASLASAEEVRDLYPVLAIPRSADRSALVAHRLTEDEQALFDAMRSAIETLPKHSGLDRHRDAVIPVGRRHGLTPEQSMAFYLRTMFNDFEP